MKFAQRWKKIGLPGACLVALAVLLIGTNAPATTGYPEVRFDYSFVPFDRVCSQRSRSRRAAHDT